MKTKSQLFILISLIAFCSLSISCSQRNKEQKDSKSTNSQSLDNDLQNNYHESETSKDQNNSSENSDDFDEMKDYARKAKNAADDCMNYANGCSN